MLVTCKTIYKFVEMKKVRVAKSKLASILGSKHDKHIVSQSVSTDKSATTPSQSECVKKQAVLPTPPQSDSFQRSIHVSTSSSTTNSQTPLSEHQQKLAKRLASSQFRLLNEKLYTSPSQEAFEMVQSNPELFETVT